MHKLISALLLIHVAGFAQPAAAQTQEIAPEALRKQALTKTSTTVPDGWKVTAKLGGSINVTDARNVVGAREGTAIQVGFNLGVQAKYKKGQHTWENVLTIQEAVQRTPTEGNEPEQFVKSLDNLDLVSTYVYRFSDPDWLGPFAQFKLNTQIFPTSSETAEPVTIRRTDTNNQTTDQTGQTVIDQTGAFEPLLLRQTAGIFGEPYTEDKFTLSFKLGLGAQQIIARGGFNLIDVVVEDDVEVYRLQEINDTFDFGAEATVAAKGFVIKDVLTWNLSTVAFLPLVTSGDVFAAGSDADSEPLGTIDRLNLEVAGGLSLKLTKYVSMDWNLLVRRFPQVRDDFQITNTFLVTLTMDLL
ncbi:MAG: DUF3078 domain-containing protein [Myxococcota bacterium]